ncbi:C-reactive protein 1.1-like [Limulus polyphemus]|uniref:Pentraxin family member n=1 Tax=Limulus polyphemus TaxID=6850 RepID=A0ABM1BQN0_LIMPO|nr:C-reactive protein 1.1-like [Limulus polyphemus]
MQLSSLLTRGVAMVFTFSWLLAHALEEGEITSKVKFPPSTASSFPRLVMDGTLPNLQEFTLCYWFKVHRLDRRLHIFSYAQDATDNEILTYVEAGNVMGFYIGGKLQLQIKCPSDIEVGKWHHVCYVWSSWEGGSSIIMNGYRCHGNSTGVNKGKTVQAGGTVVLGQEQDTVGGGFVASESMEGELSELNMWNSALDSKQILHLSKCADVSERHLYGNIIRWEKTTFIFYDGVAVSPNEICA